MNVFTLFILTLPLRISGYTYRFALKVNNVNSDQLEIWYRLRDTPGYGNAETQWHYYGQLTSGGTYEFEMEDEAHVTGTYKRFSFAASGVGTSQYFKLRQLEYCVSGTCMGTSAPTDYIYENNDYTWTCNTGGMGCCYIDIDFNQDNIITDTYYDPCNNYEQFETDRASITQLPTKFPSNMPTDAPSPKPTVRPTMTPSYNPSDVPTRFPSYLPSEVPSDQPSLVPSKEPSGLPTEVPSIEPSLEPTSEPSSGTISINIDATTSSSPTTDTTASDDSQQPIGSGTDGDDGGEGGDGTGANSNNNNGSKSGSKQKGDNSVFNSGTMIIFIVIAGVFGAIVLISVLSVLFKRKKRKNNGNNKVLVSVTSFDSTGSSSGSPRRRTDLEPDINDKEVDFGEGLHLGQPALPTPGGTGDIAGNTGNTGKNIKYVSYVTPGLDGNNGNNEKNGKNNSTNNGKIRDTDEISEGESISHESMYDENGPNALNGQNGQNNGAYTPQTPQKPQQTPGNVKKHKKRKKRETSKKYKTAGAGGGGGSGNNGQNYEVALEMAVKMNETDNGEIEEVEVVNKLDTLEDMYINDYNENNETNVTKGGGGGVIGGEIDYGGKDYISKWRGWTDNDVNGWIRYILEQNSFGVDEIDGFMKNVFERLNITGKVLMQMKNNERVFKKFQAKIENESFGIAVIIATQIENLE